jgi:hypothetical protein
MTRREQARMERMTRLAGRLGVSLELLGYHLRQSVSQIELASDYCEQLLKVGRGSARADLPTGNLSGPRPVLERLTCTTTRRLKKERLLGIARAASILGVTRQHVYLVFKGVRRSPRVEAWLRKNLRRSA